MQHFLGLSFHYDPNASGLVFTFTLSSKSLKPKYIGFQNGNFEFCDWLFQQVLQGSYKRWKSEAAAALQVEEMHLQVLICKCPC